MESWENKIIRDKIDSLQRLPDSYLPDLSSKWEIIEAGLPVKKKSSISLLVKWSVAAAIIIGVFLTGIELNETKKAQEGVLSSIRMPSLYIPKFTQKEQVTVIEKPAVIKKNRLQKVIKPVPVSKVEVIAKQDKQQLTTDEFKINGVNPVLDSAGVSTDELAITIPPPEMPKRIKRRTFQKDFNDGLLVMDTGYSKPANPQFSFRLQLHKSTGDEAQPSRRLHLKQVL